jgi:putative transposase
MPDYRRNRVAGGTYFFTVNLANRASDLLVRDIAVLRHAVKLAQTMRPFSIDAFVVLPEHLHCIWTLPEGDADYSTRWRAIKARFSMAQPAGKNSRGERGIWQKRFWEHTIRDERDYRAHMDYVHFNPVKHGYVDHPAKWPHSTFLRCAQAGFYDADWATPKDPMPHAAGERA